MITTPRLIIRPWRSSDAEAFFELAQDQGFTAFQINNYKQESLETARAWIREMTELHHQTGMGKFAVIEADSGKLLGMGGLTPWQLGEENLVDITYRLRESAWGKGFGFELAQGLVDYGFKKIGLRQITATITPDNEASKKIAAKLAMIYDQRILLKDVPTDVYRLTLP